MIDYMLRQVSVNRANDMWDEIYKATAMLYMKSPGLQTLIETQTGIVLPQNMVKKPSLLQKILNRTVKKWL